jgi:gliding motility-associated-like protein
MKNIFILLISFFAASLTIAQIEPTKLPVEKSVIVNSEEYNAAKLNGTLDQYKVLQPQAAGIYDYSNPSGRLTPKKGGKGDVPGKASGCNCYVEPDSSYTLALAPNDDGSSALIPLPFPFCFYGDTVTSCYINNNGNITFGSPLATFSATAFPSNFNQIIAPFWGDVDTRPLPGSGVPLGQVVYKMTPTALYVNWDDVGYFNIHGDKRNSFQLIITNGLDPVIDGGNVAFCYKDMQWTTGDASGGVNGFGGTPATCGANKGNNINYFLVARFDHPGTDFDGALGNPDGISWLDYKSFFFDVCNTTNIPPVPNGASSCDTFRVCSIGDTADVPFIFLSPEANQITSIAINPGTLTNLQVISNIPGNTASAVLRVAGASAFVGTHTVVVTATDNNVPPGVTTLNLTVIIDSTGTANFNPSISPTSGCDSVVAGVLNGPYDSYLWDDLLLDSTSILTTTTPGWGVTVEKNGCFKRVTANIIVSEIPDFNLVGDPVVCPGTNGNLFQITDSIDHGSVTWGLPNPAQDTLWSNILNIGTYTLTVTDINGICSNDTTFSVTNITPIVLQPDTAICTNQITFTYNSGGSGSGGWSVLQPAPPPVFVSGTNINTTVTFPSYGIYNLIYADNNCAYQDTVQVTYAPPPVINFNNVDFFVCPNGTEFIQIVDSALLSSVSWGLSNPALDTLYSANLGVGTYTVEIANLVGCTNDSTFTIETQEKILINQLHTLCGDSAELLNNFGVEGGTWSKVSGPGNVTFYPATQLQTTCEFSLPGTYIIMYSEPICNDFDTLLVDVTFYPYVVVNDIVGCQGVPEVATTFDTWENIVSYEWSDGQTGPTATLSEGGYYYVTATNICGSHTWVFLFDARPCDIEMPNVFTPNGDLVNGLFLPIVGDNFSFPIFKCQIFNRWGNVLYEFTDMTKGWNGTSQNGTKAEDGVYFYKIEAQDASGKEISRHGFFHLISN